MAAPALATTPPRLSRFEARSRGLRARRWSPSSVDVTPMGRRRRRRRPPRRHDRRGHLGRVRRQRRRPGSHPRRPRQVDADAQPAKRTTGASDGGSTVPRDNAHATRLHPGAPGPVPTRKQHPGRDRICDDWLVVSHVLPVNPRARPATSCRTLGAAHESTITPTRRHRSVPASGNSRCPRPPASARRATGFSRSRGWRRSTRL